MSRLIVTAAGGGSSNNLIRALRRTSGAPHHIVGTNIDEFYLARSLADRNYLVPKARDETRFLETIRRIVERERIELLIANNDAEVGPISAHRAELGTRVFLPAAATIALVQDKLKLSEFLAARGFPVAQTRVLGDGQTIERAFAELPPADLYWCRMRLGSASRGSLPVKTAQQAAFWVSYWQELRGVAPSMFTISEYLPGRDFAFMSLWQDGQLVLAKTCERLRYLCGEWFPSGTSSTPRVGRLVNDPVINDTCTRAVCALDPHATGMFCVDLKANRGGVPCITEINIGRFFMISPVFNLVGRHNMAELYLKLAFGERVDIDEAERYSDIGTEEILLVRELDNEPAVYTRRWVDQNHIAL